MNSAAWRRLAVGAVLLGCAGAGLVMLGPDGGRGPTGPRGAENDLAIRPVLDIALGPCAGAPPTAVAGARHFEGRSIGAAVIDGTPRPPTAVCYLAGTPALTGNSFSAAAVDKDVPAGTLPDGSLDNVLLEMWLTAEGTTIYRELMEQCLTGAPSCPRTVLGTGAFLVTFRTSLVGVLIPDSAASSPVVQPLKFSVPPALAEAIVAQMGVQHEQ